MNYTIMMLTSKWYNGILIGQRQEILPSCLALTTKIFWEITHG